MRRKRRRRRRRRIGGPALHAIYAIEVGPRRSTVELLLGAVPLPKLFDLVAALSGSLGRRIETATGGEGGGDLVPLAGLEVATVEGVPFGLVRI